MTANKPSKCVKCSKRRVCDDAGLCRMECAKLALDRAVTVAVNAPVPVPVVVPLTVKDETRSRSIGRTDAVIVSRSIGCANPVIISQTLGMRRVSRAAYATRAEQERAYTLLHGRAKRLHPVHNELRHDGLGDWLTAAPVVGETPDDVIVGRPESCRAYRQAYKYLKRYGFMLSIADITLRDVVWDIVHDAILIHKTGRDGNGKTLRKRSKARVSYHVALQTCARRMIRRDGKLKIESNIGEGLESMLRAEYARAETLKAHADAEMHAIDELGMSGYIKLMNASKEATRAAKGDKAAKLTDAEKQKAYRERQNVARTYAAFTIGNDETYKPMSQRSAMEKLIGKLGLATRERASAGAGKRYKGIHTDNGMDNASAWVKARFALRETIDGEMIALSLSQYTTLDVQGIAPAPDSVAKGEYPKSRISCVCFRAKLDLPFGDMLNGKVLSTSAAPQLLSASTLGKEAPNMFSQYYPPQDHTDIWGYGNEALAESWASELLN